MQERHTNKEQYFNEQTRSTQKFIVPYISEFVKLTPGLDVLEIGCGIGGNMKPFLESGCRVTGIDISEYSIGLASQFYTGHPLRQNLTLICNNIYHITQPGKQYGLIIMRDVIEHIPEQEVFMEFVKRFLKPGGFFFLAFPPWQNPFGGHQQICNSRLLSKIPYFHLLPNFLYKSVLSLFERNSQRINELLEIKKTGISIERFERIVRQQNYRVAAKTFFLVNPNYEIKFRLKALRQNRIIGAIPYLRDYFTTAAYYLLKTE